MRNTIVNLLATALLCASAQVVAQAGKYPARPVRMMLPFSAGTQTDVLARLIGQKLTESLGKQIVVDNRSGAGGMVAMQLVANSIPDGYTLFFDSSGFSIRPHLYAKAEVNIARDFQAVSLVASTPHVVVVSTQLGPKTLKEFLEYARRKGDLNWSHAGVGTSTHLVGELFMQEAKLKNTGIPFRGAPEAMTDAVAPTPPVITPPPTIAKRASRKTAMASARSSTASGSSAGTANGGASGGGSFVPARYARCPNRVAACRSSR